MSWRPRVIGRGPYDFIKSAERARLEAKWALYQDTRKGAPSHLIAQRQRNFDYYEINLPKWREQRAETDRQRARMLDASAACVASMNALRGALA